jgi:thioredoxin-related protein
MKRCITVAAVLFLALGMRVFAAVDWGHDYDAALEKAKKDNKLVIVDLYTDWCGWCKRLDKDTYSNKDVEARLTRDFVAVKLNPEQSPKGAQLARQFGTTGFPHIVFVNADGKRVYEIGGYLPPDQFLKELDKVGEQAAKK